MSRPCVAIVLAAAVIAALSGTVDTDIQAQVRQTTDVVRVLPLRGNVFVLTAAGSNIVASVGKDGVLLVDAGPAEMADKLLAEIKRIAGNTPIRFVINTHVHGDHTGGNEKFRQAGRAIIAGNVVMDVRDSGAAILLVSEELEEIFSLSDRIAVIYEGEIVGDSVAADAETVGLLMTGGAGSPKTEAAA